MSRLLVIEIAVFILHARVCFFEAAILFRRPPGHAALGIDPLAHALADRASKPLFQHFGGGAQTLNGHQFAYIVWIDPGIPQRDVAAVGVGNNRNRCEFFLMDELSKIVQAGPRRILAIGRPSAITMPSQVGGDDMPILAKFLGNPVPATAVVSSAMQENQRWSGFIAPIHIVKTKALRNIGLGGWSMYHLAIVSGLAKLVQSLRSGMRLWRRLNE